MEKKGKSGRVCSLSVLSVPSVVKIEFIFKELDLSSNPKRMKWHGNFSHRRENRSTSGPSPATFVPQHIQLPNHHGKFRPSQDREIL
jgi:hypothetical protein